jgi:hypothetical protein
LGKNIVIGDPREDDKIEKTLSHEIISIGLWMVGRLLKSLPSLLISVGGQVKTPTREQKRDVIAVV